MDDSDQPEHTSVVASSGPWTFHLVVCVTATCPGCGTSPADEQTGLPLTFDSTGQARDELVRCHGWHYVAWPAQAKEAAALLCPACAGTIPRDWPWPDRLGPCQELPANAAVHPAGASRRRGPWWLG